MDSHWKPIRKKEGVRDNAGLKGVGEWEMSDQHV
jgi:hypothetical protein